MQEPEVESTNLSKTDCISIIYLVSHPKDSWPTASALSLLIHRSFPIDRLILWSFLQLNFLFIAGDKIEKNETGWACGAYGCGEGSI